MNRWFYYIRVSSKGQKTDRQDENKKLKEFCQRMNVEEKDIIIIKEKVTGGNFDRPQYKLLKQVVNDGDNIIVGSIDRFGRNYIEGRKEFSELISKGVRVYVLNRTMLEELYKLNDSMSKFMINFLVDWELINAEEELKRIRERQREGIEVAKKNKKHLGRPRIEKPENFIEVYNMWKCKDGITAKKAMELLGIKRNKFYDLVKEHENEVNLLKKKEK